MDVSAVSITVVAAEVDETVFQAGVDDTVLWLFSLCCNRAQRRRRRGVKLTAGVVVAWASLWGRNRTATVGCKTKKEFKTKVSVGVVLTQRARACVLLVSHGGSYLERYPGLFVVAGGSLAVALLLGVVAFGWELLVLVG